MNLKAQLWIHLPLTLMIEPACIKYPTIPQICSQMPYLLHIKIILVIWSPLMICHISFLLMTRILFTIWIKMWLSLVWWKEDTAVGNIYQIIFYKNTRLYFSACSDKNNKWYYYCGFSRINSETRTCFLEHKHSMWQFFTWLLCFVSLPSFTLLVELVF